MNRITTIAAGLSLAFVGASVTFGDTITVPDDYATIQEAVNAANNGDEIVVGPGTYTGTGDQIVDMLGKSISVSSSDGPEATILDGESLRRGVVFNNDETLDTQFNGFTIQNCVAPLTDLFNDGNPQNYRLGGGIFIGFASPVVSNCIVVNNSASGDFGFGGGIWVGNPDYRIDFHLTDCVVSNNSSAGNGSGLFLYYCRGLAENCSIIGNNVQAGVVIQQSELEMENCDISQSIKGIEIFDDNSTIRNCVITNNDNEGINLALLNLSECTSTIIDCTVADNNGHGISCKTGTSPVIRNCLISGNTADTGAGLDLRNGNPTIIGCTIENNVATNNGGGIYFLNDVAELSNPTIINCTIRSNTAILGGGAYSLQDTPNIVDSIFQGNTATNEGGGMFANGGNITLNHCVFADNSASGRGGGYMSVFNNTSILNNCLVRANDCSDAGGGLHFAFNSNATITDCSIKSNTALVIGGGVYFGDDCTISLTNNTVCDNSVDQVGSESGTWTDNGGNVVELDCSLCDSLTRILEYESLDPSGSIDFAISDDLAVILDGSGENQSLFYKREQGNWNLEAIREAPYSSSALFYPCKRVDISGDLVITRADSMAPGGFAIFNRNGGSWNEEYSSSEGSDSPLDPYGLSCSISGNVAIVGNPASNSNESSAVVYERSSDGTWNQQAVLNTPNQNASFYATDVAIDGSNLIVSSLNSGAFYYRYNGEIWDFVQELTHPKIPALGGSVDINGDIAIIGNWQGGDQGAMVFRLTDGLWIPEQLLSSPDVNYFGYAVRIDGEMIVVASGPIGQQTTEPGSAHVYRYQDGVWTEIDVITGTPNPAGAFHPAPRIAISGQQVGIAFYDQAPVQFLKISLHTYLPEGPPSGLDCNGNDRCDELDLAAGTSDDCNGNSIPDECDITSGISIDANMDGVPDECQCPGDYNSDGDVNVNDVLLLLIEFGSYCINGCESDFNGDGEVKVDDLINLFNYYGVQCE